MSFHQLAQGVNFTPIRKLLYYSHRVCTLPTVRRKIIKGLCAYITRHKGPVVQNNEYRLRNAKNLLSSLNNIGYTSLPTLLRPTQIDEIHEFLKNVPVAEHRNAARVLDLGKVPADARIADYFLSDVLRCPHVVELANHPLLLGLAGSYIGCKPTISLINLRWSFPGSERGSGIQAFHRDYDDWRFLKVFFYLTDVDETSGPHVYISGTHRMRTTVRMRHWSDDEANKKFGSENLITVTGRKGQGFAVDTLGIHKGLPPISKPRLILQIQYSILPVFAYDYQPQQYFGSLKLDSYVNRLFLKC